MKTLHIPIYEKKIRICFSESDLISLLKQKSTEKYTPDPGGYVIECAEWDHKEGGKFFTMTVQTKDYKSYKNTVEQEAIVHHECGHLACMLMDYIGVEVNKDNDELIFHTSEYLYKKIKPIIDEKTN